MENFENTATLQQLLLQCDELLDAYPVIRRDSAERDVLVVYAVPAKPDTTSSLARSLEQFLSSRIPMSSAPETSSSLPDSLLRLPLAVVPVNTLPRDRNGGIDVNALRSLVVKDPELLQTWSRNLESIPGVDQAIVVESVAHHDTGYLHLGAITGDGAAAHKDAIATIPAARSRRQESETAPEVLDLAPAEVHSADPDLIAELENSHSYDLATALRRAAESSPDKGIHYIDITGQSSFQSYPELLENALRFLESLRTLGVRKGQKVILQCANNRDFLAVFWACVLGGIVPIPVTIASSYNRNNAVVQKLVNVWQLLEDPLIVCTDDLEADFAHLANEGLFPGQGILPVRRLLDAAEPPARTAGVQEADWRAKPDDLALLLLTSGSTGMPKAVMHTHRTLINRSAAASRFNHFDVNDVSLNWMPLDHVGGIVMFHLRDVYNACSQVQIETDWVLEDPLRWLDAVDQFRVSVTWAPNFAFGLVVDNENDFARKSWDLSCMRFMLNGGEAVVASTARRFLRILGEYGLPASCMHPAWGMSETASGICYSHDFSLESASDRDEAVEVGGPIPNTSIRIVDPDNRVLREGEKGNLQVRGACITSGYYGNPEVTASAFTEDGWFDTGDAGVIRDGQLTITARVKDEIIINGINYPAQEVEAVTEKVSGVQVSYTAACGVRKSGKDTDSLVIFFCPEESDSSSLAMVLNSIQKAVASSLGIKPDLILPLLPRQIPKTNIGKIQRSELRQQYHAGMFDQAVKQSEQLLGKNLLPDWFFEKIWVPKSLPETAKKQFDTGPSDRCILVFRDEAGLADAACDAFRKQGDTVVTVSEAEAFMPLEGDHCGIQPSTPEHYRSLFQSLQKETRIPDVIIHCWSLSTRPGVSRVGELAEAHQVGLYSLLNTIQALAACLDENHEVSLFMVTAGAQQFMNEDEAFNPHSAVTGLMQTIPYEMEWLSGRHVDFATAQSDMQLQAQSRALVEEVDSEASDTEIIYRDDTRFGWQLKEQVFTQDTLSPCLLKPDALVLITGGLGGVGSQLAKFLLEYFNARLMLVGRTVLPPRETWNDVIRDGGADADRIREYLEIEATGGEFTYHSVDVCDIGAMQSIVEERETQSNSRLAGIFHLAVGGDMRARWKDEAGYTIETENTASYEEIFATKVYASWQLAQLVSRRDAAFLVSFGSVIGTFGVARFASYAAAHACLSQMTRYFNRRYPDRYFVFNWSVWEDTGISKLYQFAADLYRKTGFSILSVQNGLASLHAGLCHRLPDVQIGLDADQWPVRRLLTFERAPLTRCIACYTAGADHADLDSEIRNVELHDGFRNVCRCDPCLLERIPVSPDGEIDMQALRALAEGGKDGTERSSPSTPIEKQISRNFLCDVLNIHQPDVHASLFQLGANSLNITQLISRLKQKYSISLNMRELFEFPTISRLGKLIDKKITEHELRQSPRSGPEAESLESMNEHELLERIDDLTEEQVEELLFAMEQDEESS